MVNYTNYVGKMCMFALNIPIKCDKWGKNYMNMEIQRDIIQSLIGWKSNEGRKPLIIRGARQIGKTFAMKMFGERYYDHVAYFNFDSSEELCREFEQTKDPKRLLGILKLYTDVPIVPHKTLLVFDEIQQCNKALNSLKYFCEEAPEYHIIAAGSLLGVSLSKGDSFPVGKVEFLQMYPVSFREFLACDSPKVFNFFQDLSSLEPLPEIIMGHAIESYRRYLVCGGMPAAAVAMLDSLGSGEIENRQNQVLIAYSLDFAKHAPSGDIPRIAAIWNSIPSQLAKENRKFLYKVVKSGARAREYEDALLWLQHTGLVNRVFCSNKPGLPLSAYDDLSAFKLYLCDVGLLRVLANLPPEVFWSQSSMFTEFKGAMAENAVLQSLMTQFDTMPRYWVSNGTAEVDFLIQEGLNVIPVEVKSGNSLTGKSLSVFRKEFKPEVSIRYSLNNLNRENNLLNIPLFMADWTKKLLNNYFNH